MGYRAIMSTSDDIEIEQWFIDKWQSLYNINHNSVSGKTSYKYYEDTYADIEILQDIQKLVDHEVTAVFIYDDGTIIKVLISHDKIDGYFMDEQFEGEPMRGTCYYGSGQYLE